MIPRTKSGSPDEAGLLIGQTTQKSFSFCLACQEVQEACFGDQFHVALFAGLFLLLPGFRNGLKQLRHQMRNKG